MPRAQRQIIVSNEHGLHARPAMQLVDLANRFQSEITLTKPAGECEKLPTVADAKSVMAVITLAATPGTRLCLVAEGPDAEDAVAQICSLFEKNFHEED